MKERNLSTFTNIDIMVNKGALACTCIPGKKNIFAGIILKTERNKVNF